MIALLSLALASASALPLQALDAPKRPRDPFVFRCVLDKKPRMVTLALGDEMWAAWDATDCGLYKAWRGGVHFDGPVYTTVHGPQPSTRGTSYTEGLDGPVWSALVANQPVKASARWRGYRIEQGHAVLQYAIDVDGHGTIDVEERPEIVHPETMFPPDRREDLGLDAGWVGLFRNLQTTNCPKDVALVLRTRTDADGARLVDPHDTAREEIRDVKDDKGQVVRTEFTSHVYLSAEKPAATWILFFHPLPEPAAETKPEAHR